MTHELVRGARWVFTAECGEGAPEAMYVMECMRCPAISEWVDNALTPVGVWAIEHAERTDHRQFLGTRQSHFRVDPVHVLAPRRSVALGSVRVAVLANESPRTPGRIAGALRRAVAHLGGIAGPVVIAAMGAVAGLCGYLLGIHGVR